MPVCLETCLSLLWGLALIGPAKWRTPCRTHPLCNNWLYKGQLPDSQCLWGKWHTERLSQLAVGMATWVLMSKEEAGWWEPGAWSRIAKKCRVLPCLQDLEIETEMWKTWAIKLLMIFSSHFHFFRMFSSISYSWVQWKYIIHFHVVNKPLFLN